MEPRNEAVWLTNDQRYDKNATEPSNDPEYYVKSTDIINYLQVGTKNPTFQFDNTLRWQRHRFLQFLDCGRPLRAETCCSNQLQLAPNYFPWPPVNIEHAAHRSPLPTVAWGGPQRQGFCPRALLVTPLAWHDAGGP